MSELGAFSECHRLSRFVVIARQEIATEVLGMASEAIRNARPWFTQGSGPTEDGLYSVTFYAGTEDARRVRKYLREKGITEAVR